MQRFSMKKSWAKPNNSKERERRGSRNSKWKKKDGEERNSTQVFSNEQKERPIAHEISATQMMRINRDLFLFITNKGNNVNKKRNGRRTNSNFLKTINENKKKRKEKSNSKNIKYLFFGLIFDFYKLHKSNKMKKSNELLSVERHRWLGDTNKKKNVSKSLFFRTRRWLKFDFDFEDFHHRSMFDSTCYFDNRCFRYLRQRKTSESKQMKKKKRWISIDLPMIIEENLTEENDTHRKKKDLDRNEKKSIDIDKFECKEIKQSFFFSAKRTRHTKRDLKKKKIDQRNSMKKQKDFLTLQFVIQIVWTISAAFFFSCFSVSNLNHHRKSMSKRIDEQNISKIVRFTCTKRGQEWLWAKIIMDKKKFLMKYFLT